MKEIDVSNMRTSFEKNQITDIDLFNNNPFEQFANWFELARNTPTIAEANGFVLATANKNGRIRSRTVLLKYFDETGFVFFTNYGSEKAHDISENNQVSMLFPWYHLELQLIIEGTAEKISNSESLKYFLSRPRGSQIGAWVSEQSKVIHSRQLLIEKTKQFAKQFFDKEIPLPDFWGGYRIKPTRFEFWQGQPDRLHNRIEYTKLNGESWKKSLLSP